MMNSRQRRKLEALQHNDKIRYEAWLRANAIYSRVAARRTQVAGMHGLPSASGIPKSTLMAMIAMSVAEVNL